MWLAVPLILLAGAVIGCGRSEDKKEKIGPDPHAKPRPAPSPTPEPPKSPADTFSKCFGGAKDYEIIVEDSGRGLCGRLSRRGFFFGNFSAFRVCFPSEPGCDSDPGVRFGRPFHLSDGAGVSSYPPEILPAPRSSLIRAETLKREEEFQYFLDGGLYDDCRFVLQLWQSAKGSPPAPIRDLAALEMPLYAPRKDGKTCTAEPDFSNEKILHLNAPLCAIFPAPGAAPSSVTATEVKAGADCDNRLGKTLPLRATLRLD